MNRSNHDNILLVHPLGYKANVAHQDVSRLANIMPPIGLASMAAYLESNNLDSGIIDCYAYPEYDSLIRKYLLEKQPAYIGFSCTTLQFSGRCTDSIPCKKNPARNKVCIWRGPCFSPQGKNSGRFSSG